MPKKLAVIFLIIFTLLTITGNIAAAPVLDSAHYLISGNGDDISALKFKMNYDLNTINSFDASFTYYNNEINFTGSWLINFLQSSKNNLNLELALATELSDLDPRPAIGISGLNDYQAGNKLYWNIKYFIEKNNKELVYDGGIVLPLTNMGNLTLGFGNSYWYPDEPQINLGLMVDF